MNILVDQSGYEFHNVGDWAMLEITIRRLRKIFPGCSIQVIGNPVRVNQLITGVRAVDPIGRTMLMGSGCLFGKASRFLGRFDVWFAERYLAQARLLAKAKLRLRGHDPKPLEIFYDAITKADLVLVSGGGFITDEFPASVYGVCGLLHSAQRLGKATAMFGQGLGPLEKKQLRQKASLSLAHLKILALREGGDSRVLASHLGVHPESVHVTGDDAIEFAYSKANPKIGAYLGINIRKSAYSGVDTACMNALSETLQEVCSRITCQAAIVPISSHPNEADGVQASSLMENAINLIADNDISPQTVIESVGKCRLVITGSYHAGVFALAQGIPVIGLYRSEYYRNKFCGLAKQFGEGCQLVDMAREDWQEYLLNLSLRMWDNAASYSDPLLLSAEKQVRASRQAYDRLLSISS